MSARILGLIGLFLAAEGTAWAAKDKGGKKEETTIQMTGIEAFDEVFTRVKQIDGQLTSVDRNLKEAKTNLNSALALKKGTPLTDGLGELKARAGDKLQLTVDQQKVPKLAVTDAVPSNVQSAVDAVNALTTDLTSSLGTLQALPAEIDQLVKQTGKFPARLKDEFSKDNGSLIDKIIELPKVGKTLTTNLQITSELPKKSTSVTGRVTDVLGVVTSEFGGGGRSTPAPAAPAKKKKG